jgi:hypothetical protein
VALAGDLFVARGDLGAGLHVENALVSSVTKKCDDFA